MSHQYVSGKCPEANWCAVLVFGIRSDIFRTHNCVYDLFNYGYYADTMRILCGCASAHFALSYSAEAVFNLSS